MLTRGSSAGALAANAVWLVRLRIKTKLKIIPLDKTLKVMTTFVREPFAAIHLKPV
jgi:hypothetical protein